MNSALRSYYLSLMEAAPRPSLTEFPEMEAQDDLNEATATSQIREVTSFTEGGAVIAAKFSL